MYLDEKAVPEAPVKELQEWQKACLLAADYIEKYGWIQGDFCRGEKVCILGALSYVTTQRRIPTRSAELSGFNELTHMLCMTPDCWNDQKGRTKEEVIAMLRSVAE